LCSPPTKESDISRIKTGRKTAIVVLGNSPWRVVRLYLDRVALAVNEATPGSYSVVDIPFK